MPRPTHCLLLALLVAACGGGSDSPPDRAEAGAGSKQNDDFEACALLTFEEIQAAAGWAPDTSDGDTHGTTKTCAYHGPDALKQSVVLVVARPAPKVSSSAELAERRKQAAASSPEIKMTFTPVEGLGMPAVRSEVEGSSTPTLELIVGNRVLGVTSPDFEATKALAPKAAARLQ
jgi:hypothetical protein